MTQPFAGRTGARIVGTIGGTAHRPPIMSALNGVAHSAGKTRVRRRYTPHNYRPYKHRPRAKDNDEPAELPSRPTL